MMIPSPTSRVALLGLLAAVAPRVTVAQPLAPDTALKVSIGGFVDTYYAYDLGRPRTLDRSFADGATFTTQPARHNEFNINLAYVEALVTGSRVHGRLALQAGTSVQSNYAAEPAVGTLSGPSLSRFIQEAYAGYRVTPSLWVDAGVFYSHMGMESWASKDNLTYTRSLVAEYSPYYSSGVRAVWQATPRLSAQLNVVNGWQNISETNTDKGAGLRVDFAPSSQVSVSYYNFVNGETAGRLRVFNGAGIKLTPHPRLTLLAQADYGSLDRASGSGTSTWYGFVFMARKAVTDHMALAARVERYDDADQVNIAPGGADPFRGTGASLGVDVRPDSRFTWRTEVRGFSTGLPIFPDGNDPGGASRRSIFVVSSFGLVF